MYRQQIGRAAIDSIHWSGESSGSIVFMGGLHDWQIKSVSVRSGVSGESVCSKRRAAAGDRVASEARRLPSVDTDVLAGLCGDVRKGSRGAANDSLGDIFGTFMCYPEASRSPRTGAELRRV